MQIAPSPAEILFTDEIHCGLYLLSSQCSHSEYSDLQPPCLLCQNPHGLFTISLDTNSLQEGKQLEGRSTFNFADECDHHRTGMSATMTKYLHTPNPH